MFRCQACLRQCLRALDIDVSSAVSSRSLFRVSRKGEYASHAPWLQWRGASTQVARRTAESPSNEGNPQRPSRWRESPQAQSRKRQAYANVRRDPTAKAVDADERAVYQELKYTTDALKLADSVRFKLRDGEERKAFSLVRLASKRMQCIVSWNHLIDYQMSKGKVNAALKSYNEMKKRAQIPDSHTYTILLRGLAEHAHFSQTAGKALSLYHSMSTDRAKVKPSIIHTNAVLKVLARAGDMDGLWGVASKIPEGGAGAADALTFTTILNAIREQALIGAPHGLSGDERARRCDQAIMEGRRMWEDIVGKWRRGDLWIDERLVCSMGRLLLIGSRPRDWDDVLSLVQQTMDIPRMVPKLGSEARLNAPVPRVRAPHSPESMKNDASEIQGDEPAAGSEFDPLPTSSKRIGNDPNPTSLTYATPSGNTLSLVLDACLKMVAKKPATDYWHLFTSSSYDIKPDLDNLHMYLRILRQSRSSADALSLLRNEFPSLGYKPLVKSFRIAMSACVRDKNNPNVMDTAGGIIDLMQNELVDPDVRTMVMCLELAISRDKPEDMLRALHRLGPGNMDLKGLMNGGQGQSREGGGQEREQAEEQREEVVGLVSRMVRGYDRLLEKNKGNTPREDVSAWAAARSKLAALVSRLNVRGEGDRRRMRQVIAVKTEGRLDTESHREEGDTTRRKQVNAATREGRSDAENQREEADTWRMKQVNAATREGRSDAGSQREEPDTRRMKQVNVAMREGRADIEGQRHEPGRLVAVRRRKRDNRRMAEEAYKEMLEEAAMR